MNNTCKDCKYYLPVDVFKGICKISKDKILPDDKASAKFEKEMKCKFCKNYSSSKENEYLGKCLCEFDAYPDMNAKSCKEFAWSL